MRVLFFARELLAPKDGRSPRAPSGRIGHAVACGGLSSGDQSGGNGLDMRLRATNKKLARFWVAAVCRARPTHSPTTALRWRRSDERASSKIVGHESADHECEYYFLSENCWRQKTDDRRARRVGGLDMPWHVVVCQVATRAAGMAWTCAYGQRTKNLHDSGLRQCVGRGQHILQQQL